MMSYFAYSQKGFLCKYIVMLSDIDQFKRMIFVNYLRPVFLAADAFLMPNMNLELTDQYRLRLKDSKMQFKRQTVAGDSILIKLDSLHVSDCEFSLFYTFVTDVLKEMKGAVQFKRSWYETPQDVLAQCSRGGLFSF